MKKHPQINIGIPEEQRSKIAEGLSRLLADSYTLYLMTHNFHWNVTGPMFNTLHAMFMAQYTEQWTALDQIAERIRALGFPAPGTYKEFVSLASIEEVAGVPKAMDMVRHLVAAQEATARTAGRLSTRYARRSGLHAPGRLFLRRRNRPDFRRRPHAGPSRLLGLRATTTTCRQFEALCCGIRFEPDQGRRLRIRTTLIPFLHRRGTAQGPLRCSQSGG